MRMKLQVLVTPLGERDSLYLFFFDGSTSRGYEATPSALAQLTIVVEEFQARGRLPLFLDPNAHIVSSMQ